MPLLSLAGEATKVALLSLAGETTKVPLLSLAGEAAKVPLRPEAGKATKVPLRSKLPLGSEAGALTTVALLLETVAVAVVPLLPEVVEVRFCSSSCQGSEGTDVATDDEALAGWAGPSTTSDVPCVPQGQGVPNQRTFAHWRCAAVVGHFAFMPPPTHERVPFDSSASSE